MTPLRAGWLALLILSTVVSLLTAYRSRRVPELRPAAVACCAFVALDAARFAGLPPLADVVAFCAMPGVWGSLLAGDRVPLSGERAGSKKLGCADQEDGESTGTGDRKRGAPHPAAREQEKSGERVEHAPTLPRLAPLAACILYAAALLMLRHVPAVRERWTLLLQVPRVALFAWALWVGLRGRERLTPSARIGVAMGIGAGLCVAGGLWAGGWWQVQTMAACAWCAVAAIVVRAR